MGEFEKNTSQVQMDEINAAMMKWAVRQYGEFIYEEAYLPDLAQVLMRQMMLIAAEVDQHFQKQGSLDGLKVHVGSCLTMNDQGFYIRNSLIRKLIDPKEMEALNVRSCSRWPSEVEGLEIRREDLGGRFEYFLAAKEANWVEEG